MSTDPVITTKHDLAEYLRKHDLETLKFLQSLAKQFGPAEMVAYVRHGKAHVLRQPNRA